MADVLHRAMVYLGLADDEFDEYDPQFDAEEPLYQNDYQQPPAYQTPPPPPRATRAQPQQPVVDITDSAISSVRTLPREERSATITPRPAVVRPIIATASSKVHVVEPGNFAEAQEIGDRLRANQPVIVTMQEADPELTRRLIDFCSGATYVIGGSMERVAKNVFLLAPSNVEVSAEERRKLEERGYRS